MNKIKTASVPRVEVVDALRGIAVMAILIIHSIEHFHFPIYPDKAIQPEWLNTLDAVVHNVVFSLIAGKAYAIFALLFGFTFYVQFTNQQSRGSDFSWRFVWRLLLLTLFATLNAAFYPAGDVLLLFSVTGLSLVLVRHMRNKVVFAIAIVCLMQPVELFYFARSIASESFTLPNLAVGKLFGIVREGIKSGDWGVFLIENITTGQKASLFWAINAGRFVQTIGLFLTGFLIGKKQLFVHSKANNKFWIKLLIICALLFGVLYPLKVEWYNNAPSVAIRGSIGTAIDMWQKLAFTFIIVASFVIGYYNSGLKKHTKNLKLYGKMSLTNYISQSMIGVLVLFPIGLHLAPYLGFTASLIFAFMAISLQIYFCKLWLKKHKRGPLEHLWGKATWIGRKR